MSLGGGGSWLRPGYDNFISRWPWQAWRIVEAGCAERYYLCAKSLQT